MCFIDLHREALEKIKKYDYILEDKEHTMLKESIPVLEIFSSATNLLEGSNYPTINLGLLLYKEIENRYANFIQGRISKIGQPIYNYDILFRT